MQADRITNEVPLEEVARRIAEMRCLSFKHRLPPVVVYHPPEQPCPWSDCDYGIAGIQFHLDQLVEPADYNDALFAWWQGPGLVARCPGCRRYVRFEVLRRRAVMEQPSGSYVVLPDNWADIAYLVPPRKG